MTKLIFHNLFPENDMATMISVKVMEAIKAKLTQEEVQAVLKDNIPDDEGDLAMPLRVINYNE